MRDKKTIIIIIIRKLLCLSSEASLRNLPADISVAPDRLEVRSGSACGAAALPPGVSLAPSSCRGLRRLHGDGLHLRLRLRDVPRAPGKAARRRAVLIVAASEGFGSGVL